MCLSVSGPTAPVSRVQSSRLQRRVPLLRLHASETEDSLPSIALSGFAQVVGEDFRFVQTPTKPRRLFNSLSSRSSRQEAPHLRHRNPPLFQPIDSTKVHVLGRTSKLTSGPVAEARVPLISQSPCSGPGLCLDQTKP